MLWHDLWKCQHDMYACNTHKFEHVTGLQKRKLPAFSPADWVEAICLSVYLFIYLSVCLSVYPSIHPTRQPAIKLPHSKRDATVLNCTQCTNRRRNRGVQKTGSVFQQANSRNLITLLVPHYMDFPLCQGCNASQN